MPEVKKTNSSVKSATATKAPVTEVKKSEVKELTEGKTVVKVIVVPKKLVNIVIKG